MNYMNRYNKCHHKPSVIVPSLETSAVNENKKQKSRLTPCVHTQNKSLSKGLTHPRQFVLSVFVTGIFHL